jgi:hypothetical protein
LTEIALYDVASNIRPDLPAGKRREHRARVHGGDEALGQGQLPRPRSVRIHHAMPLEECGGNGALCDLCQRAADGGTLRLGF